MDEPRINGTFTIQVTNLPALPTGAAGMGIFVYGFSKTEWGSILLPYDLGSLGIFGCFAHISVDAIIPTAWNRIVTTLYYPLFIPNDPSMVGVPFYNQCAFVDPLAQPTFYREITVSNAMEGVVGPAG